MIKKTLIQTVSYIHENQQYVICPILCYNYFHFVKTQKEHWRKVCSNTRLNPTIKLKRSMQCISGHHKLTGTDHAMRTNWPSPAASVKWLQRYRFYPPGNDLPLMFGMFASMIFRLSRLVGYVSFPTISPIINRHLSVSCSFEKQPKTNGQQQLQRSVLCHMWFFPPKIIQVLLGISGFGTPILILKQSSKHFFQNPTLANLHHVCIPLLCFPLGSTHIARSKIDPIHPEHPHASLAPNDLKGVHHSAWEMSKIEFRIMAGQPTPP